MADLEHKINPRAHRAGLRRLSERANAFSERISASSSCSSSSSAGSSLSCDSIAQFGKQLADHLRASGIPLAPGLSDHEFERIEALQGFSFPPDLRALLAHGVPSGAGFPDWRSASPATLARWIGIPGAAIGHRVERSGLWRGGSPRGTLPHAARRTARYRFQTSPVMVPVFGLFFLPASPARAGNPLFLVHNGAIVCCGGGIGEFVHMAFLGLDENRNGGADDREEGEGEFPFAIEEEFEEEEEEPDRRRWSTSFVENRWPMRSMLFLEERSKSLPAGCREAAAAAIEGREFESWGRNLDALATTLGTRKKKNRAEKIPQEDSPSPSLGQQRTSFACYGSSSRAKIYELGGSKSMPGARLNRIITRNLAALPRNHYPPPSTAGSSSCSSPVARAGGGVRRIEFWSDVADRMIKQSTKEEEESFALSMCLAPIASSNSSSSSSSSGHHHHRRTVSFSAAIDRAVDVNSSSSATEAKRSAAIPEKIAITSPRSAVKTSIATKKWDFPGDRAGPMSIPAAPEASSSWKKSSGDGDGDGSQLVASLLEDVAARLRSAGWREEEVLEMVEGASPKSVLDSVKTSSSKKEEEQHHHRQNGSTKTLDSMLLSSSLKAAGFSAQEVSDALCFDLGVECRFNLGRVSVRAASFFSLDSFRVNPPPC